MSTSILPSHPHHHEENDTSLPSELSLKKTKTEEEQEKDLCPVIPVPNMSINWKKAIRVGNGLDNFGNSCFMNSALQVLAHTAPLFYLVLEKNHGENCKKTGFCAFCSFEDHIIGVYGGKGCYKPVNMYKNIRQVSSNFTIGYQEDSHEFLINLLDKIQESDMLTDGLTRQEYYKTDIFSIFGGFLRSRVVCSLCNNISDTFDPFTDISLEINQSKTLAQCFRNFTKAEILTEKNQYVCESCKKISRASKRFTICEPPAILTIQLKRFKLGYSYNSKISKEISYPESIDLSPYLSDNHGRNYTYSLYGVLVHSGSSPDSGHYYSFIKSSSGSWMKMNDTQVKKVQANSALNQKKGAYLLFYSADDSIQRCNSREMQLTRSMSNGIDDTGSQSEVKHARNCNVQIPPELLSGNKKYRDSNSESSTDENPNRVKIPKIVQRKEKLEGTRKRKRDDSERHHDRPSNRKVRRRENQSDVYDVKKRTQSLPHIERSNSNGSMKTNRNSQDTRKCYNCGEPGHISYNCKQSNKNNSKQGRGRNRGRRRSNY